MEAFLDDETGQGLIEYVLIVALIAMVAIVAITAMGTTVRAKLNNEVGQI